MKIPTKGELARANHTTLHKVRWAVEDELRRRAEVKRQAEYEREEAEKAKTVTSKRVAEEFTRCGKKGCHCGSKGSRGHGPYRFEVTTFANGRRKKRYLGKATK